MDHWEAVGRTWQETSPQRLWRAHSDAVHAGLLARWLPSEKAGRLLKTDLFDEAFGEGLYRILAQSAQEVVGIDVSAATARAARARQAGLLVARADVRRLPFADGTFAAIVSNSTLDHFAACGDILASLCELARVLQPGGQLLLTLDNVVNPTVALRNALPFRLLHRLGIVPYYVGASCSPRYLAELLSQAGLVTCEMGAILHCPRVLAVPLAGLLDRYAGPGPQATFLRCLLAFERLGRGPWPFITGHFLAARALKP